MSSATTLSFDELQLGQTAELEFVVDDSLHAAFVALSGDESPIHVDDAFARTAGFSGRVMHGAIINAFVSQLVGMKLPGAFALLLAVDLRYHHPVYMGDRLRVTARVARKSESQRAVSLAVTAENATRENLAASGTALVKVRA